MGRHWRLAAVTGWAAAAVLYVGVCKLVRVLLQVGPPAPAERVEAAQQAAAGALPDLDYLYPPGHSAGDWGKGLAYAAKALARDGFEDQAHRLFGISGELLEAADRGKVHTLRAS